MTAAKRKNKSLTLTCFSLFKGGNPLQRNLSDAAALEAKVAAKKAQQAVLQPSDTPTAPVRKKVVTHKKDSVDDLLSTGLTTIKQRVK